MQQLSSSQAHDDVDVHVDSVPEPAQESLAVVLEEALQEFTAPVAAGQLLDVHDLDAAALLLVLERPPEDALAHAVVGGQLLQRGPAQVLLVVAVLMLRLRSPEEVLRAHLPEGLRDGGAQAQAPTARRSQHRRRCGVRMLMMMRLRHRSSSMYPPPPRRQARPTMSSSMN